MLLSQAHAELRSLYTVHTEGLIHALMRQSVRLLRRQEAAGAVGAARQAWEVVHHLRCLPLLQAQAAALLGHCCTVHSHLGPQPAAGEPPTSLCMTLYDLMSLLDLALAVVHVDSGPVGGLKQTPFRRTETSIATDDVTTVLSTKFAKQSSHTANVLQTKLLVRT